MLGEISAPIARRALPDRVSHVMPGTVAVPGFFVSSLGLSDSPDPGGKPCVIADRVRAVVAIAAGAGAGSRWSMYASDPFAVGAVRAWFRFARSGR